MPRYHFTVRLDSLPGRQGHVRDEARRGRAGTAGFLESVLT
jgi:hypothetical protein